MVKILRKALSKDKEKDIKTSQALSRLQKESEEEKAAALAENLNLFYADLNLFPISSDDIRAIPEEEARRYQAAVFQKGGKNIRVALADPANKKAIEFVEKLGKENNWDIRLYVVSRSSMAKALEKYKDTPILENLENYHVTLTGKDLEEFEREFKDLLELKKRIREIPTTQIITVIMAGAVKMKASDVHLEPQEKEARLRYRLDGVLQDIGYLPTDIYRLMVSRIKMMGKMKINLRDIAQDGQFTMDLNQNSPVTAKPGVSQEGKINVRVNIIPGKQGESIVMRLLNVADVLLKVENLGLRGLAYEQVRKQISKPHGMLLNTGPTGSGKTTTLYALINNINTSGVKIITIEDPVEYEIKGISQTQVAKDRGYTFTTGLRAIVRQDPDVILVGEIRDDETADIALNAALTGHLVLSTLHTNNAAGAIPRLLELGVKPNLIAPAVNAIIAQRLVRRLCPYCRKAYKPAKDTVDSLKKILAIISPKAKVEIPKNIDKLYRPVGCPRCHNLGYKGRVGIFEVLTMSESIEKLILEMAGEGEIARAALEDGMMTMAQDGILKTVEGITSLEEVWRATGQTEFLEDLYERLMKQSLSQSVKITEEVFEKVFQSVSSFKDFEEFLKKANQKETFHYIVAAALLLSAGDIHVEPEEEEVLIRIRIDGILQTIGRIPLNEYPTFLGEIKQLCGLKTEVRQGITDSRFSIIFEKPFKNITGIKVDVRVSIILGGHGETVVMRLLNQGAVSLDIEKLGIRNKNLEKILHEIKKPNGFFLNTGPTGSGKTTTLYSLLKVLNKPEVKIITVEDPIEYQLDGVLQTQVNQEGGYTFPTALRALLRQNPDIMMIGEIRDDETAGIAVQAALTGHLVLSTLHTNDAAGAVSRLLNMGLRADDLATAANGFMAQRLVRKLCECREKAKPTKEEKEVIDRVVKSISPKAGIEIPKSDYVYKPRECLKCNGIGYKGRTTISEVMVIGKEIEEMIYQNALSSQICDKAVELGMLTMAQDGILKVLEGETTLEEVERVTEE